MAKAARLKRATMRVIQALRIMASTPSLRSLTLELPSRCTSLLRTRLIAYIEGMHEDAADSLPPARGALSYPFEATPQPGEAHEVAAGLPLLGRGARAAAPHHNT